MKFAVIAGAVVLAGGAAGRNLTDRAEALFWSSVPATTHYLGYIEGETTLVAPPVPVASWCGKLERGDRIDKGNPAVRHRHHRRRKPKWSAPRRPSPNIRRGTII